MAPPNRSKFADNEKVLCYHGPLLYEAKCVRSRKDPKNPGEFQYFVHYQGWNKNWDEWVGESRILKVNTDTMDKKGKLMEQHVATVKSNRKEKKLGKDGAPITGKDRDRASSEKGGPSTPTPTSSAASSVPGTPITGMPGSGRKSESASTSRASTPGSERSLKLPGGKRSLHEDDEQSNSSREDTNDSGGATTPVAVTAPQPPRRGVGNPNRKLSAATAKRFKERLGFSGAALATSEKGRFRCTLPEELRSVLVSDWDLVMHKKSVFALPAKISAATIIADFVKHAEKEGKLNRHRMNEVMLGMADLFNCHLDSTLLYRLESKQFDVVMSKAGKDKLPSDVYGSAHLLRLLVKLPEILNNTSLAGDETNVGTIDEILNDFQTFLEDNRAKYFTSKNYLEAQPELLPDE